MNRPKQDVVAGQVLALMADTRILGDCTDGLAHVGENSIRDHRAGVLVEITPDFDEVASGGIGQNVFDHRASLFSPLALLHELLESFFSVMNVAVGNLLEPKLNMVAKLLNGFLAVQVTLFEKPKRFADDLACGLIAAGRDTCRDEVMKFTWKGNVPGHPSGHTPP